MSCRSRSGSCNNYRLRSIRAQHGASRCASRARFPERCLPASPQQDHLSGHAADRRFDASQIINAAERLAQLVERDEAERADGAERASAQLGTEALLFGMTVAVARVSARRAQ